MSQVTHIPPVELGPAAAGMTVTPKEFDTAEFEPGWRYELIHGVLVVSPATLPQERGPNELLGYWLLGYRESHPNGFHLDDTLPEHDIHVGSERRRADRVIWAGLGRSPRKEETPTVAVEFVSAGKRNLTRDFEHKRHEYGALGILESWVFNRFEQIMTIFKMKGEQLVLRESDVYSTDLLPGFNLTLAKLFAVADRWDDTTTDES